MKGAGVCTPAKRGHLSIKRFPDTNKLSPGARKRVPHDVAVDHAPTTRGSCVLCGSGIVKGALRITLMLQCHKGYKNASLCHLQCFPRHPESGKIESMDEFLGLKALGSEERKEVQDAFDRRARLQDVPSKEEGDDAVRKGSGGEQARRRAGGKRSNEETVKQEEELKQEELKQEEEGGKRRKRRA
mmetsp:Transcript_16324/g.32665  ORF Transcript_16324/g.32665 Transcript_16324/m.32665 type:complete len:186 (+) Transcript_16324:44-601(+)